MPSNTLHLISSFTRNTKAITQKLLLVITWSAFSAYLKILLQAYGLVCITFNVFFHFYQEILVVAQWSKQDTGFHAHGFESLCFAQAFTKEMKSFKRNLSKQNTMCVLKPELTGSTVVAFVLQTQPSKVRLLHLSARKF